MLGACYVFYFYFYFDLRSTIFSENVRKPINKKMSYLRMYLYCHTKSDFMTCSSAPPPKKK